MRKYKGFSLIELMITVAIIGILSLMALPFYKNYTSRVYIMEAINVTNAERKAMLEALEVGDQTDDYYSDGIYYSRFWPQLKGAGVIRVGAWIQDEKIRAQTDIALNIELLFGLVSRTEDPVAEPPRFKIVLTKPSLVQTTGTIVVIEPMASTDLNSGESWVSICGYPHDYFTRALAGYKPEDLPANQQKILSASPKECRNILLVK